MNFYDFSGGIVNQKSPYLLKRDEATELVNFNVEQGGLTVRAGTRKRYGPFSGEVTAIHKALSTKGHEILFVQCDDYVEIVVGGTKCNLRMAGKPFQVLPVIDGFTFLITGQPYLLNSVYRRVDGVIPATGLWNGYLVLERLSDDYSTRGEFPSDLFGKNIWDEDTNTLYYAKATTNATRENIGELLKTDQFVPLGKAGELIHLQYSYTSEIKINLKTLYQEDSRVTKYHCSSLFELFQQQTLTQETAIKACKCPYIVWHPASMRYFAAGHPDYPTALFVSEPNEWYNYQAENVLYPHLHLGNITGLSVVEKSVVVSYEYGWSHYVGSDPTEDAQWSLLSVPDGVKYGDTVCTTPGSVTFLSDSGLMSFSSSMLTVQMIYSPSSSLYKFLSHGKLSLPKPQKKAFALYRNGTYYLWIDDTLYLYDFTLGSFLRYRGLSCQCLAQNYGGEILMGAGRYITVFADDESSDYDPLTDSQQPIFYSVKIPVAGVAEETELARSEELAVKSNALCYPVDCHIRLSSEREEQEGVLVHANHLDYKNTTWNHRYRNSEFSETVFFWKVTGNLFFLEIFGNTNPLETSPLQLYNIYITFKKERDK